MISVHQADDSDFELSELIEANAKMVWRFSCGNWACTYSGSFKQACFVARKMYQQAKETNYGIIFVEAQCEIPETIKQKQIQKRLF